MALPPRGTHLDLEELDDSISLLIESVYWGIRDSYRLSYTSSGREKERREVCITLKGRDDLFASSETGGSYVSDRSAASHVLQAALDPMAPPARREKAFQVLGDIGTDLDLPALRKIVSGPEESARAPAFHAMLKLAARSGQPPDALEKALDALDPPGRLEVVKSLPPPRWEEAYATTGNAGAGGSPAPGVREDVLEALLVRLLQRPAARSGAELRLQALLALGRLERGLSAKTLDLIASLATDPDPLLRLAASGLLAAIRPEAGGERSAPRQGISTE